MDDRPAGPTGPMVVTAEDDESVRTPIRIRLEEAGDQVAEAADGGEVIDLVDRVHPDIVLLDVDLPSRNGHDLLRSLKDRQATKDIPVVLLTAQSSHR